MENNQNLMTSKLSNRFLHFLSSCKNEDDLTKLKSYIYYLHYNFISFRSFSKDFEFDQLVEKSKLYFKDQSHVHYLEFAVKEIKEGSFNINNWKEVFYKKRWLNVQNIKPSIKKSLRILAKDVRKENLKNLVSELEDLSNVGFLNFEVRKILAYNKKKSLIQFFSREIQLKIKEINNKPLSQNSKSAKPKELKSEIFEKITKKVAEMPSTTKKEKVYSRILILNDFNSENEEDILHRK